jgi:TRAP-type uncharacterized transport system fused permease subunit
MAAILPRTKARRETGDKWIDKLAEDIRNPVKVLIACAALIGFVVFVVTFVTGG